MPPADRTPPDRLALGRATHPRWPRATHERRSAACAPGCPSQRRPSGHRSPAPHIRSLLPLLRDTLTDLPWLHQAWIFGSWATRALGARGARPNDIDVLLVADATIDKAAVYKAAREAEAFTPHEVNVTFVTPERWAASDGGFITDVLAKPRLLVWQRPPA